jgi:predicted transcriptional regulator
MKSCGIMHNMIVEDEGVIKAIWKWSLEYHKHHNYKTIHATLQAVVSGTYRLLAGQ